MISPNTAPGTEVVCVATRSSFDGFLFPAIGQIYTVREIRMSVGAIDSNGVELHPPSPCVLLNEIVNRIVHGKEPGFPLKGFRYLDKAADISFYNAHVPINLETVTS